jgi:predicted O-methyltransferase YrrM
LPIIANTKELLEGNIFMTHHTTYYADVFLNKVKNISNLVLNKNIKSVMEIGFNSGFSTLLMLISNPNIHITCYDLGEHKYTIPCYQKLREIFKDRINIIIEDSRETLPSDNDIYDLWDNYIIKYNLKSLNTEYNSLYHDIKYVIKNA